MASVHIGVLRQLHTLCVYTGGWGARPHNVPNNLFMREAAKKRSDINKEIIQNNFVELDMFNRFVDMEGLRLFHCDDQIMCPLQCTWGVVMLGEAMAMRL